MCRKKIIELIKENCALDDEVTYNTRFAELSIDSLSFITAIVEIETYFGIDFDDGFIMSEYEIIEDFIKFVEEKIDEKHKC